MRRNWVASCITMTMAAMGGQAAQAQPAPLAGSSVPGPAAAGDDRMPPLPSMEGQQGEVVSRTAVSPPLKKKHEKEAAELAAREAAAKRDAAVKEAAAKREAQEAAAKKTAAEAKKEPPKKDPEAKRVSANEAGAPSKPAALKEPKPVAVGQHPVPVKPAARKAVGRPVQKTARAGRRK